MNGHRQDSLSALLAPSSVALIGASEDVARIGGRPLRYLREAGFKGAIYPVNPNRETVQGYKSYPSIGSIPETPDVAMLAVPAHATVQAVRDCAAKGVRAAIVFSAGFAEADEQGRAHQEELSQIAKASGMRVLGPNCLGVFNSTLGYYGTFSAILDREFVKPGPVAVVSQASAALASVIGSRPATNATSMSRKPWLGRSSNPTSTSSWPMQKAYETEMPSSRLLSARVSSARRSYS